MKSISRVKLAAVLVAMSISGVAMAKDVSQQDPNSWTPFSFDSSSSSLTSSKVIPLYSDSFS